MGEVLSISCLFSLSLSMRCLFIVLKISLFSMSSSHDPVVRMFSLSFYCFENLIVLHVIQS